MVRRSKFNDSRRDRDYDPSRSKASENGLHSSFREWKFAIVLTWTLQQI
jgi:hypothetical protein